MKVLKKFNRGFLVFCVVALCAIVYIVGASVSKNQEITQIRGLISDFMNSALVYMRSNYESDDGLAAAVADANKELAPFFTDGADATPVLEFMDASGSTQEKGKPTVYDVRVKVPVEAVEWQDDGVMVSCLVKFKEKFESGYNSESEYELTFVCKEIDGEWKISFWRKGAVDFFYGFYDSVAFGRAGAI